jgi:hypothetical protein
MPLGFRLSYSKEIKLSNICGLRGGKDRILGFLGFLQEMEVAR